MCVATSKKKGVARRKTGVRVPTGKDMDFFLFLFGVRRTPAPHVQVLFGLRAAVGGLTYWTRAQVVVFTSRQHDGGISYSKLKAKDKGSKQRFYHALLNLFKSASFEQ